MKKVITGSFLLTIAVAFASCDKPIAGFDNSTNYIYIDRPYALDKEGVPTKVRVDGISHSFGLEDKSVTSHTFDIPVSIIGLKSDKDRSYVIEVVPEETSALDSEWDKSSITDLSVKSGKFGDTVKLTVNRLPTIKTEWHHITFRVVANDNFKLGTPDLLTIKISFTDQLLPPDWWDEWFRYFGEFSREKFVKWQEIYYLGADPNKEKYNGPGLGKLLYWNNMPSTPYIEWYPSTFIFIRMLKYYFIENEEYPDDDRSKPRITLP